MKLQDLKQYGAPSKPEPRRRADPGALAHVLSGDVVSLSGGRSFYREERFGPEYTHGMHRLLHLSLVMGRRLAVISKDPELSYVDLRRAVFLDTETTGLGMGAGTYVFLVGAGYMDGESFRVRQFFLSGPDDEVAYLDALDQFLSEFGLIVTFNGKAFDWPLLEGRYARHRRPAPLNDPPHIDLLHPARRVWKRRLESCALTSLESNILRVRRTQKDVAGWEIPQRYFAYLRAGDALGLEGVFYHNLQDILSLAALAVQLDQVLIDPLGGLLEHGIDFLCVGKIFERAGDYDAATTCYEEALRRPLVTDHRGETLLRLSGIQKRLRLWELAVNTWERMVDEGGETALPALIELAKFYEHVERDYPAALDAVRQAQLLIELRPRDSALAEAMELEHRLGRLLNRSALGHDRRRAHAG